MSNFNKFKTNSYCVVCKHYSGTNNIQGVVTAKGTKIRRGSCAMCRSNKSMTINDATVDAEGLKDFIKSVGKATVKFGWKVANDPIRALDIASKIGNAAASKNQEPLYQPHLV